MPFLAEMDGVSGLISPDMADDKGRELAAAHQDAEPFPHTLIDDFLPTPIAQKCLVEFAALGPRERPTFDRAQERFKTQSNPDRLSAEVREIFYSFNSLPFVRLVENITGIEGLIPDPYFLGGGLHETTQGGHLSIHTDFNHHTAMDLERRVNVLIYLNETWKEEWGGCLELWDRAMRSRVKRYLPSFNRCVIFNTTATSFHGNPEPVVHPLKMSRKSIALYYYTATWSADQRDLTTQFKVRRSSDDRIDWAVKSRELLTDLAPPLLVRGLRRLRARP